MFYLISLYISLYNIFNTILLKAIILAIIIKFNLRELIKRKRSISFNNVNISIFINSFNSTLILNRIFTSLKVDITI